MKIFCILKALYLNQIWVFIFGPHSQGNLKL